MGSDVDVFCGAAVTGDVSQGPQARVGLGFKFRSSANTFRKPTSACSLILDFSVLPVY